MASIEQHQDVAKRIYQVYLTILLFGGLAGHLASAAVFWRFPSLASANTRRFFICLAAADAAVLLTAVLRYWQRLLIDFDIRSIGLAACKIHTFAVYLFCDLALWLLVALSVVRLLSIVRPTWRKPHTSPSFVPVLIALLTAASVARNWPLLHYLSLESPSPASPANSNSVNLTNSTGLESGQSQNEPKVCDFSNPLVVQAFVAAEFVLYSAVPCFLLAGCNICLAALMYRAAARRRLQFGVGASAAAYEESESQSRSGSQMVLILSAFYLCSNLPSIGFYALSWVFNGNLGLNPEVNNLLADYLLMFHFSANGTSFLFYCSFNANFRRCLKKLFLCKSGTGSVQPLVA